MKILVVGNCQFRTISDVLSFYIPEASIISYRVDDKRLADEDIESFNFILAHKFSERYGVFSEAKLSKRDNVFFMPYIVFSGFHPDCIYHVKNENGELLPSPVNKNSYHSLITACSFIRGLSEKETFGLFTSQFYKSMNYYSYDEVARGTLTKELDTCGMPGKFLVEKWSDTGRFMYTVNHCKAYVLIDIATQLANQIKPDLGYLNLAEAQDFEDYLALDADFYSVFENKRSAVIKRSQEKAVNGLRTLDLSSFIAESYEIYQAARGNVSVEQKYLDKFDKAYAEHKRALGTSTFPNPYKTIPRKQFWRKSVSKDIEKVDVSIRPKFAIDRTTRVATAGSCFAQHIARSLHNSGFTYYISEVAPDGMDEEKAKELSYGLFSSRYGNIYTVKQLVQLFERAFGLFEPQDVAWKTPEGFVDPLRPNLGEYFDSIEAVKASTEAHLTAVREQFRNLELFIFTLGLTEAWENSEDGTVYPVCPYAIAEQTTNKYQFVNYDYSQTRSDLNKFISYLVMVNPSAKLLLTVSPVPLIATYENKHVLISTTESKAILRSVAGDISKVYSHVEYFPSYEVITGSYNQGQFFEDNLREVKPEGVNTVMQTFYRSFESDEDRAVTASGLDPSKEFIESELSKVSDIVCDEELLDQ